MQGFSIRNASEQDLTRYPDFFALAPHFNSMNLPPDPCDEEERFLTRVRNRTVDKLAFYGEHPVFYLSFRKSTFSNTVDTMILDDREELDRSALYQFIRTECLDRGFFLTSLARFEYHTTDHPLNREVLTGLGFTLTKNHRIMNIFLNKREKPLVPLLENIQVHPVEENTDLRDRVRIQNEVFDNRNRIPLAFSDVQKEMKNSSYMPELSLLLRYDGTACGYGQIIRNPSGSYLVNFGVIPAFQGQGLSHILLDELLTRAELRGLDHIMLEVIEDNFRAVHLYEKHGFKKLYNKCLWVYQKGELLIEVPGE